ncbi:putative cell wall manno protein PIR3, partial [Polychaeton citri CBS 116435]
MQYTLATLGLVALAAAAPAPQGVTSAIAPTTTPPSDCKASYDGKFQIQIVNVTSSTGTKAKRQADGTLTITLSDGVLTDQDGRTGYIAANDQFQFDGPPQTGAKYTAGFALCSNNSLTLGDDAIFYGCLSGTFYNLYDENDSAQCTPIYIQAIPYGGSSATGGEASDGQPTATSVVSQLSDGQVTGTPVSSPITQISDGQPQAPTSVASPITQISDGQPQAPTSAASPITQISDGQPQAPTSAASPITQISDGQPQAPTSAVSPITQISDGQPQAPTSAVSPVTQISDGQPQAPTSAPAYTPSGSIVPVPSNGTSPTSPSAPPVYTGA